MSQKQAPSRNRILVACTTCQSRRVKCVCGPAESRCEQCQRSNLDCVMRPDGRRRPISRAEVDSLRSRLQSLEALLRNQAKSGPSPTANLPSSPLNGRDGTAPSIDLLSPNSRSGTLPSNDKTSKVLPNGSESAPASAISSRDLHDNTPPDTAEPNENNENNENYSDLLHGDYTSPPQVPAHPETAHQREGSSSNSPESPLADNMSDGPSKTLIDGLTSLNDDILHDPSSGRLRLACPIIAFHQSQRWVDDIRPPRPGSKTGEWRGCCGS